jgi:CHASE2 domain-containing sensor protein
VLLEARLFWRKPWASGTPLTPEQEDGDQFVRRQQILGRDGNRLLPRIALALYARVRGEDIDIDEQGRAIIGGVVVPADDEGKLRINYVGPPGTIEELSFGKVLEVARKKVALPELDGAAVLIGITVRDQQDYHSTPWANFYSRWTATHKTGRMAGVEVQANILATLIDRAWVRTPWALTTLPWLIGVGAPSPRRAGATR